jgi:hypothetical protein
VGCQSDKITIHDDNTFSIIYKDTSNNYILDSAEHYQFINNNFEIVQNVEKKYVFDLTDNYNRIIGTPISCAFGKDNKSCILRNDLNHTTNKINIKELGQISSGYDFLISPNVCSIDNVVLCEKPSNTLNFIEITPNSQKILNYEFNISLKRREWYNVVGRLY